MVFLSLAAHAQVNFNLVPSDVAPDLGATITVDVAVDENFQDIGGFQFTIDWDETLLSYQGLSNFGLAGLSGGNFGTTQTGNGILTVSWPDPFGGTQSIDMDSVIFTLTFDVIATGASSTTVDFTSSPLSKEVLNGVPEDITGSVLFNNSPTIAIGGGGNPGTNVCNFMGFGLAVTSDSADTGDPVCVDVIACNFTEIVSFQYTTQFDPNKLQFDSITNFNLDNLSAGNFGTTNIGNGFITSSWLDTLGAGVTVADETALYSICFTAVGAGGDIDTVAINGALSQIEVTDANSNGADIGLESIDGEVKITGNSSSAVSIKASCEQGNPGDTVTVDISVANFDSISGMQMSMLWDPTIITFLDREWTGQLPGSPTFNTSSALVDAGKLTLLWDDPNGATSSVMDDSIIFKVRYVIVGDVTDVSPVSFTDDPTAIEITQVVNGSLQSVPLARIQGKVEVVGEGVLGFIIEDAVGCTNDTICIPVTVDNFNEITSMQYDFEWNDTDLTYVRTQNHNSTLEGLTTGSFNQYNSNHVRLSWTQGLLEPRTLLEGNDTLFQICFKVNGAEGSTTNLIFDETQTIEVSGGPTADLITVFTLDNGVVTVDCAMDVPMTVSDTTITNVLCNGENTGSINLTLSDATGAVTFLWSNGAVTQNISNLVAGTYSVTITDDNTTLNETYTVTEPASALSVSMSSTDVTVNGGSDGTATATPAGGTAPYSYLWDNGGTTATISGLTFGNYTVTVTDANNCTITDQVAVNQPGSVTAVISSSDVTCNGFSNGSATVTPGGGVPGYTILWSTGATTQTITGLAPGNYSVTVTDSNTATAVASVTITQPTILTATVNGSDVTCSGESTGSATVTAGGGTPGYTYLWSNGVTTATISNVAAGNYSVTVTDGIGCTTSTSITITQPTVVSAIISSSTNVACNGDNTGSATVLASGGTPGYTYLWSNGATTVTASNLVAGSYTVTVMDVNNCSQTTSITITEPTAISANITSITDVACNGAADGSATVSASGGTPGYTYLWSNGGTTATINNLAAGIYTVTVTDANNCTQTTTATISEMSTLIVSISSSTNVTCNGDANGSATVTAGGGAPGYTYLWSNGATTATITNLNAGGYTVTVTDVNNCSETATVTITEPTALNVSLNTNAVSCNGFANGSITATPFGGTAAYTFVWSNGATGNSISSLAPGTYTVTLTDGNNCTITETATITQPDALTVTGVVSNESALNAEDGAIDITPAGGTAPWTYVWSTGATTQDVSTLTPGSYSVTITDVNGCTVSESFTVNSFEAPQITVVNVVDVLCNGDANGAIDISVAGGVSPYTYLWTTGATTQDISNLAAGNYSVTVTDNIGSIAVQTITVAQSAPITVTLDAQVNVACNGDNTGSISITVVGGTPNYSFNWGGGITAEDPAGLSAGTYTPTITDANGCTAIGTPVTITEPNPISISVSNVTNVACNGESTGSIDVDITGGTPGYTYLWSNGSANQDPSALPAGNYTLTVTDAANCILIGPSITVSEPQALTASSSSTDVTCDGASDGTINLTVNGGTPTYSYNWSGGLPNQPNHINVAAGSYSVTITDISGCSIVEGPIQVSEPTAIILTNTVLSASATNDDGGIDLTVTGGTPGYTYEWNTGATSEDLSGLSSGCYAVTVTDANGCMAMDSVKVGGVIVISSEVENTSCAGLCDGSIDITINGGIAPYTYSWTGPDVVNNAQDQNSLCAGTYSVTVLDANSTQSVQSFTIESPTALTVANSNIINESGNGCNGSIDITITGGTLPYTYQWSNGASSEDVDDLCKGDYSVTIVDANGCVLISNQFTVLPPPLVVAMSNMTMASCSGEDDGEACLSVLGGCGPYTVTLGSSTQVSVLGEDICFSDLAAGTYVINVVDSGNPQMTTSQEFTITTPDPIAITSNIINNTDPTGADCDGSIDITVVGGTIPYSYQWSNGASSEDVIDLCSGGPTYSVTVTDANGCVQILNGLEVELGLNVQVVATEDVSCMGDCDGSIDISVTGGVGPYTYSWSNAGSTQDLNNLCTGSYDVTVTDANGMMANFFGITIAEPSAPLTVDMGTMVRPTGDNANGSISLDISGGWGGYTIEWSNGATGNPIGGLVEGFYTATVTDANGCVQVIIIDLPAYRLILIEELIEPTCNGDEDGQIEVVIQGGSGEFTITWDNGQTGPLAFSLATGTYCVTVSDNSIAGLEVTECYDLGQPDELVAAPIVVNSTGPADGSIEANVSGGTAPYTYLWTTGDVTPITDGLVAGVYGLVITDANGCELIVQQIEVGVEGECFEGRKVISPNGDGRNDEFIISCVEGINNNLKVFNRWGQLVYEADNYDNSWSGTEASGNILPESGYFWVLEYDENGQTKQIKGAFTLLRGDN